MTNANDVRRAHDLLDSLFDNSELSHAQIELIRGLVPELPKQKTLAEIIAHVDDAWSVASDNDWGGNSYDPDVSIEDWLTELHAQLKGVKDTPAAVPALPEGLRLAIHEEYGRCVVTPKSDNNGVCEILYADSNSGLGSTYGYAHECELTFIDAEPAKPAHPEFLDAEADYRNAPRGTVAAKDGWNAWLKETDGVWSCGGGSDEESRLAQTGKRRVLRWGWKNEQL